MSDELTDWLRLSDAERRHIVRAALKWWRERHPEHRAAKPVSHGYYGWVMWSVVGEAGPVAQVRDIIREYCVDQRQATRRVAMTDPRTRRNPL